MRHFVLVDKPDVSIIVPMYNAQKYVAQTIDSLLKQSYPNFEIIIVNDGSTDDSEAIINKFSYDSRIKYFKKENGGTGSALNFGHERAVGKYITWCSADNIYFKDFINILRGALLSAEQQGLNTQLMYSDFCFMNANGKKIRDVIHKQPQRGVDLIEGYDVGMSFMYTKALWDKTGTYWDKICEDFHWCVRAAEHTGFGLVPAVLAAFRVHGDQITGSRAEEEKAVATECKELAKKLFGHLGKPENTLEG